MKKKAKIIGSSKYSVKMECPNCGEHFLVRREVNKWTECFRGECWVCGYKFILKDTDFDIVQPDSPFFEMIYRFHPEKEGEKARKKREWQEQKRKEKLEEKYFKMKKENRIKPWEEKSLKKEILLED